MRGGKAIETKRTRLKNEKVCAIGLGSIARGSKL
jgi:hypothetical protein